MSTTIQPSTIDGLAIRKDFPIFQQAPSEGRLPLVFLDSAASSQRPAVVIDTVSDFYSRTNANIHRGVYQLSEQATLRYEEARHIAAQFINAANPRECIFVRNTTEAINLVANSWGRAYLNPGDRLLLFTDGLAEARRAGEFFPTVERACSSIPNSVITNPTISTSVALNPLPSMGVAKAMSSSAIPRSTIARIRAPNSTASRFRRCVERNRSSAAADMRNDSS